MQTETPQSGYSDIIWWDHYIQWYDVGGISAVLLTLANCWPVHTMWPPTLGDWLHFSRHTSHMCNVCHMHLNSTNSKPDRLSDFYKSSHVHLCHLRCMVTGLLIYLLTSWAHSREMWGSQNHHHMNAAVQLQKRWTWDAIQRGLALYIVLANFGYY